MATFLGKYVTAIIMPIGMFLMPPISTNVVVIIVFLKSMWLSIKARAYPIAAKKKTINIMANKFQVKFVTYGVTALLLIITIAKKLNFENGAKVTLSLYDLFFKNSFTNIPNIEGITIIKIKPFRIEIVSIFMDSPTST